MWRRPAAVVARQLGQGTREERALAILLAACLLMFASRLPVIRRAAMFEGGDFLRDASYEFFALMMLLPLIFYALAALGRLVAGLFGLRVSGYGARIALFWAYLAAVPAALLYGLVLGFIGAGPGSALTGAIWVAAFLLFWTIGLRVAGQRGQDA